MKLPKKIAFYKKNFLFGQPQGGEMFKEQLLDIVSHLNEERNHIICVQTIRNGDRYTMLILAEGQMIMSCDDEVRVCEPSESPCRTCTAGTSCNELCADYHTWQKKACADILEHMLGF